MLEKERERVLVLVDALDVDVAIRVHPMHDPLQAEALRTHGSHIEYAFYTFEKLCLFISSVLGARSDVACQVCARMMEIVLIVRCMHTIKEIIS